MASSPKVGESVRGESSRRQLTVMFCDLVGSTVLAGELDPEDYFTVIRAYGELVTREVERFGGHVAQYVGDGILVYFGYPVAHEDDAERAVRAALAILDAIDRRRVGEPPLQLAVRMGIHTGPVLVGEGGESSAPIFGQTPAIAMRIQTAADPNTVQISRSTQELVAGLFVVEDRGPRILKGVGDRVRLYRVIRPSGVRSRLDAAAIRHLTPFVDRESERRLLLERWHEARRGHGQVVTIAGEAGIGKSRLVYALQEALAEEPHTWIKCHASVYHQDVPFYAIVDMLQHGFGWAAVPPDRRLEGLERAVKFAGLTPSAAVPALAPLLGLRLPAGEATPPSPLLQRKAQLSTLAAWLLGLSRAQPVVTAIENLQWADPSTLELLAALVEEAVTAPLLLVLTARPEFHAPWPLLAHHALLSLTRLSAEHVRELIGHVAGRGAPSDDVMEAIVARAEGIPLFAEELSRAVLGSDAHGVPQVIPATLADSLMGRLDRLGQAKQVAQLGAVLGREFDYPLLRAVSPLPDDDLEGALSRLVDAEVLYVHGVPPEATYVFKHALVRDAAYESLVRAARPDLHRRIAITLRDRFPEIAEAQPELLAHHFACGGDIETAVRYWKHAGDRTMARAAYPESIRLFEHGLALVERLSPQRRMEEQLALTGSLGTALLMTRGYSSPEAEQAFRRGLELCTAAGLDVPVRVLYGIWAFHVIRSDREATAKLLPRFHEIAERSADPVAVITAHATAGFCAFLSGDFVRARDEMVKATECYDTPAYRQFITGYGYDGGLSTFMVLMWVLWILGYPERSVAVREQATAFADRNANPYSRVIVSTYGAALAHDRREPDTAQELSEQAISIANEYNLPSWLGPATCLHGWASVVHGDVDRGIADIRRGLDLLHSLGFRTWYPYYLSFLGEADLARGMAAEGLTAVQDALNLTHVLLDCFYEAELHRLEGDLLRLRDDVVGAEAAFQRALQVAGRQQARSFALRAATSHARLQRDRGDQAAARRTLEPVYRSFTEGFDTPDLRAAKALLEQLGTPAA